MKIIERLVSNIYIKLLFWFCLSALFMIGYPLSPFFEQFPFHDSGVYITESDMILNGAVIYRDFIEQKGPLLYLFEVGGLSVGGLSAIWCLCCLWGAIIAAITDKICSIFSNNAVAVFITATITMLMTERFGGNNTAELIVTPFLLWSIYLLLKSFCDQRIPPFLHSFIIGMTISIIIFVKANIAGVPLFLLFVFFVYSIKKNQIKTFIICISGVIVGALAVVAPIMAYFMHKNALSDFINTYFLFNYKFAANTSEPISIIDRFLIFIKLSFLKPVCIFGWCFVLLAFFIEKSKKELKIFLLCLSIIIVEAVSVAFIPGRDHFYYITPMLPLFAFFIIMCLSANGLYQKVSIVGTVALFAYLGTKSVHEIMVRPVIYKEELNLCAFIKEHTSKEDNVIFYNAPVGCYFSSGKLCPSKYPYVIPNGFLRDEIIADYLSREPLYFVIKEGKTFPMDRLIGYEQIDYPSKTYKIFKLLEY